MTERSARRPYDLDALTDVALRVFALRGYDGATMDEVAAAAGITKAAIYHHVPGKEALLARGLERALDALFATLDEAPARKGSALERLRYVVRRVAELALAVSPELTVLVRVRGNSETERGAIARRRAFDRIVTDLFVEAQSAAEIDASLDASLSVRLVFGMCNSLVEWYRPSGKLGQSAIARAVVDLLFDGIAPATPERSAP